MLCTTVRLRRFAFTFDYQTFHYPETMRLARRASTIARLAQVISEREVPPGLRRTLLIQAERLRWLAEQPYKPFEATAKTEDAQAGGEE